MASPHMGGFRETTNDGGVIAGIRSKRRAGVFSAKLYSSHRFRLESDVGDNLAGTIVYLSVQSLHAQPESVRSAAKWICQHPLCNGKTWNTKGDALEAHGDTRILEKNEESHCLLAIGKLPADVAEVVGVTCKKDTHVFVALDRRIDLSLGDTVFIKGVLTSDKDEDGKYVEHACNGTWLAIPMNAKMLAIECDGGKAKYHRDPKSPKATVLLHPERPVLLSDEE